MSTLAKANLALFALLALHTVDHAANQPSRELPDTASVIGIAGFAIVALSTVLALRRAASAPAASLFAGLVTAGGFVAVHLVPTWSGAISDPYWDFEPNALSWALMRAPLAAALVLAAIAAREPGRVPLARPS